MGNIPMKVLIACEESQRVCTEFRRLGHEAYSCDVQEPSGGHPEWHILGDVLEILNPSADRYFRYAFSTPNQKGISFETMDGQYHQFAGGWDLIIAHPPCTYLTVSGNRWFNKARYGDKAIERFSLREDAVDFFMKFARADCERIAIENPIGCMSRMFRKPDQIVQPYEFGHPVSKKTCLWLKGLPKLEPTEIVEPVTVHSNGKSGGYSGASLYARGENGKILAWNDPETAKIRSKTFHGIAKAMAEQWGCQA